MRLTYESGSRNVALNPIAETFERLRWTADLSQQTWIDLLGIHWWQYHRIKAGLEPIPDHVIERVAQHFHITPHELITGNLDFGEIAATIHKGSNLPERYTKAAYGRKRTTITSIEFLEMFYGWRLKLDVLKTHNVTEADLRDPFAPISMQFITDICAYLHDHRQFRAQDFLAMGAYSYLANRKTLVGQILSEMRSPFELYDFFFNEAMKLFERNCRYTISKRRDRGITLEILSHPDVAAESGVRHLGNAYICHLKAGVFATLTRYIGLPNAFIRKTSCVHRGDSICRYECDFPHPRQGEVNPPASRLLH